MGHLKQRLLITLLGLAVMLQGAFWLWTSGKDLREVQNVIGKSSLWRGAYFSQGSRFADFIVFLDANLPMDGRLVLPPIGNGPRSLGTTPLMQFFMAPRTVINCTDSSCIEHLSVENTYLLVAGNFPPAGATALFPERRMFDSGWGVMLPPKAAAAGQAQSDYDSLLEIAAISILPLLWLFVLTFSGGIIVHRLTPHLTGSSRWSLGYGLGLACFTLLAALASLTGLPLTRLLLLGMTAFLLAGAMITRHLTREIVSLRAPDRNLALRPDLWTLALLIPGCFAAILAVGQGYHASDEILLWGAKGYGISTMQSIQGVMEWGTNTVQYPLHIPLLIAAIRTLFGETLPASKLIFAGYYLGLLLLVDSGLRSAGLKRQVAGLSTLLIATTPLIFRHGTLAYANLALTFYLFAGIILLVPAIAPKNIPGSSTSDDKPLIQSPATLQKQTGINTDLFLMGLFAAFAGWTRPEGFALALLGSGIMIALFWKNHAGEKRVRWVLPALGALILYALFWFALQVAVYTRPTGRAGLEGRALNQILAGNLHLPELGYILHTFVTSLFDAAIWGALGFMLVGALLVIAFTGFQRASFSIACLSCGLIWILAILGMYYITSFDTNHDTSWWVSTGLDRMLMPAILSLGTGLLCGMKVLHYREDRSGPSNSQ